MKNCVRILISLMVGVMVSGAMINGSVYADEPTETSSSEMEPVETEPIEADPTEPEPTEPEPIDYGKNDGEGEGELYNPTEDEKEIYGEWSGEVPEKQVEVVEKPVEVVEKSVEVTTVVERPVIVEKIVEVEQVTEPEVVEDIVTTPEVEPIEETMEPEIEVVNAGEVATLSDGEKMAACVSTALIAGAMGVAMVAVAGNTTSLTAKRKVLRRR